MDLFSDDAALLLWFTYDFAGNPMPLYAEAKLQDGKFVGSAFAPYGPRFGDFDPRELLFESWGELAFQSQTCQNATLGWTSAVSDSGQIFGQGATSLMPLALPAGPSCAPGQA